MGRSHLLSVVSYGAQSTCGSEAYAKLRIIFFPPSCGSFATWCFMSSKECHLCDHLQQIGRNAVGASSVVVPVLLVTGHWLHARLIMPSNSTHLAILILPSRGNAAAQEPPGVV